MSSWSSYLAHGIPLDEKIIAEGVAYSPNTYTFSKDQVEFAYSLAMRLFHDKMALGKQQNTDFSKCPEALQDFYMREGGRFDMNMSTFASDLHQVEFQPWLPLIEKVLSTKFILDYIGCVVSNPGDANQNWHIDGMHLSKTEHLRVDKLVVFVPLVDITEENGGTEFVPLSHIRHGRSTHFEEYKTMSRKTFLPKSGHPIFMDYRVWHRGLKNTSHEPRPLLYFKYKTIASVETKEDSSSSQKKNKKRVTPTLVTSEQTQTCKKTKVDGIENIQ